MPSPKRVQLIEWELYPVEPYTVELVAPIGQA